MELNLYCNHITPSNLSLIIKMKFYNAFCRKVYDYFEGNREDWPAAYMLLVVVSVQYFYILSIINLINFINGVKEPILGLYKIVVPFLVIVQLRPIVVKKKFLVDDGLSNWVVFLTIILSLLLAAVTSRLHVL